MRFGRTPRRISCAQLRDVARGTILDLYLTDTFVCVYRTTRGMIPRNANTQETLGLGLLPLGIIRALKAVRTIDELLKY